jgi:hypothetical protein
MGLSRERLLQTVVESLIWGCLGFYF